MIKGVFHIVVGVLFWTVRPVTSISIESIQTLLQRGYAADIDGSSFQPAGASEYIKMYSTSYTFMVIGLLYIAYGIYVIIKETKNENNQSGN